MSRTRSRILIYSLIGLVLILLAGGLWASRLQASAERLASVGKEAIALLSEYGAALQELDTERALACYTEGYANPQEGAWVERLDSDRDGVQVYTWEAGEPGAWTRDDVREQLNRLLVDRKIELEVTEAAENQLAELGYDPTFGARPVKRTIQQEVQNPLAMALLEGKFEDGDTIKVDYRDGQLVFERQASLAMEEVEA